MPAKDKAILSISTKESVKADITRIFKDNGMSISKIPDFILTSINSGEIVIQDGELVIDMPKVDFTDFAEDRCERKAKRFIEKLQGKGYPDRVIEGYLDNMLEKVNDMGRFNPKRVRYDEGC